MDEKRFESEAILERIDGLDDRAKSTFTDIYFAMVSVIIETAYTTGDEEIAEVLLNAIDNSIGHAEKLLADRIARLRELEEKISWIN